MKNGVLPVYGNTPFFYAIALINSNIANMIDVTTVFADKAQHSDILLPSQSYCRSCDCSSRNNNFESSLNDFFQIILGYPTTAEYNGFGDGNTAF